MAALDQDFSMKTRAHNPSKNKLSRRKKARAKKTLHTAITAMFDELKTDTLLRNYLFLERPTKNTLVIGAHIIVKTEDGHYNIYRKNLDQLIYENVFTFDAALALVESLNVQDHKKLAKILEVEQEYVNYFMEVRHFKNAYDNAVRNKTGNEGVFQDRYAIAKNKANIALDVLRSYRTGGK